MRRALSISVVTVAAIALLLLTLAAVGNASTVTISSDSTGTPLTVFAITTSTTSGAEMALSGALQVVVHFVDGTGTPVGSSSANFVTGCGTNCGSASGSVVGGGTWTLSQTGDTGSVGDATNPDSQPINFWTLSTTSAASAIASVDLMGGPTFGNVVFDRDRATGFGATTGGQIGTPGSAFGIDFVTSTTYPSPPPADSGTFAVNVTYSNIVKLAGAPGSHPCQNAAGATAVSGPFAGLDASTTGCGDTWQNVTFTFSPTTAFTGTSTFHFFQDTDIIGTPDEDSLACRGPGYWSMHAGQEKPNSTNQTSLVLASVGSISVCGQTINPFLGAGNTGVNHQTSPIEALCMPNGGDYRSQVVFQLTAAKLNCAANGSPNCVGDELFGPVVAACDNATVCAPTTVETVAAQFACVSALECLHNGGIPGPLGSGFCGDGHCSDNDAACASFNKSLCGAPATATCNPAPNCLELSFPNFPDSPAGSIKACRAANRNACTIFGGCTFNP